MANSVLFSFSSSRRIRSRLLAALLFAGPALSPALLGCSDQTTDDGSIRGTVTIYVATFEDGSTQKEFRLQIGGDETDERRLFFAREPDLTAGNELKVWGTHDTAGISVERFELVGTGSSNGLGTSEEAIIDGTPYPARTFAYVLVNVANNAGSYTESAATIDMFGTGASDASVKQWFLEASYGRQDLSGRVITGLTYNMNGCDTSGLASGLRSQVNSAFGSTPQHYLWYFLSNIGSCGWSGLAQLGSGSSPSRDSWYNNSNGCVVLVQEPAHNFGMQHSSSLRCGSSIFSNTPSSCTHDEYGDRHDPMGGGCRHTNAWQKAYQGWFGGCNSVRVNTSGTFTLHPLEVECNGIQVLQIPMPAARTIPRSGGGGNPTNDSVGFYYLELRTRTGFDQSQTSYPTVLVHVGPDYRARNQNGLHTWILDMNPATTGSNSFDGMSVGQTFTDPAGGVSFTAQAISATSATINVTVPTNTANTCAGGGTLTPPGPSTCSGTGGTGGMGGMGGAGMAGMGGAGTGGGGMAGRAGGGAAGQGGAGAGGAGAGGAGAAGRAGGGAGGAGAGGASAGGAGAGGAPAGGAGAGGASGASVGGAGAGGAPGGSGGDPGAGAGGLAGGGFAGGAGLAGGAGVAGGGGLAGGAGAAGAAGAAAGAGPAGAGGAGVSGATGTGGAAAGAAGTTAGTAPVAGSGFGLPSGGTADDDSGCACRIDQPRARNEATLWLGFAGVLAAGVARRRRSRQYKRLVK